MTLYTVEVTQAVVVDVDESKFTEEFMQAFREGFYDFDDIEDHVQHLAQMEARGLIGYDRFVEGYGDIREMGVKMFIEDQWEELEDG